MSRRVIVGVSMSMHIALPSCSLLIDTNPDGLIDESGAAGHSGTGKAGKSQNHGAAGAGGRSTSSPRNPSGGIAAAAGAVTGSGGAATGGVAPATSAGSMGIAGSISIDVGVGGATGVGGAAAITDGVAGGGSATGGILNAGGIVAAGGVSATGGAPNTGGATATTPPSPPSCENLPNCGADSCCTTIKMEGGKFRMGRSIESNASDFFADGNADETPEHEATVAAFALDKYEVTIGRFRRFADAFAAWRTAGNPKLGDGLNVSVEASSPGKTGWGQNWSVTGHELPVSEKTLKPAVNSGLGCSWRDYPGTDVEEAYPMNCVNWFQAFAFCIWDGGRLPTEAEWEYAAAGGTANRLYPWAGATADATRANYVDSAFSERKAVGSYPLGVGIFGHQDLAGSMNEWVFDRYSDTYYQGAGNSCNNCVNVTDASGTSFRRVSRGGSYNGHATALRAAYRYPFPDGGDAYYVGLRCARSL